MPSSGSNPKPKLGSGAKPYEFAKNLSNSNKKKQTWNMAHKDDGRENEALSQKTIGGFNQTSCDGKVQGAHPSSSSSKKK